MIALSLLSIDYNSPFFRVLVAQWEQKDSQRAKIRQIHHPPPFPNERTQQDRLFYFDQNTLAANVYRPSPHSLDDDDHLC
jgi:hypothetical protein